MLHMPEQRERCPKDPEFLRLRNRERQQQCRARKREKAKKDAASQLGDNPISHVENLLPLTANDFLATCQNRAPLASEIDSHPLVHQNRSPGVSVMKHSEDNFGFKYLGLFQESKSFVNLKTNVGDGDIQYDSSNKCFDKDSHNIPQPRIKIEDSHMLLDGKHYNMNSSAAKHLPKNRDELRNSEIHRSATLQIVDSSAKNASIECGIRVSCHRKWKRDARMGQRYKQHASSLPEVQLQLHSLMAKKDVCSSQWSRCDLKVGKDTLSSMRELNSEYQVNHTQHVDTVASHGRRNWKAAARSGGWDSSTTM